MAEQYLAKCDINGDGVVDVQDWQLFKRAFPSSPNSPNWDARCDFNGDGVVDTQDYQILKVNMGKRVTPDTNHKPTYAARMLPIPILLAKLFKLRNAIFTEQIHKKLHPII